MARNTPTRTSMRGNCANPLAQSLGSGKHKVAPAPPQLPDDARASTPTVADNNNQPKNGVSWPAGSIPRRVKKLSWDDESCQQKKVYSVFYTIKAQRMQNFNSIGLLVSEILN